jgi:hypothetical protein
MSQFAAQVKQIQTKNAKKIESSMPMLSHQLKTIHLSTVYKRWVIQKNFLLKVVLPPWSKQQKSRPENPKRLDI